MYAGTQRIVVTATVGLVQCTEGAVSLEALLSSADAALYAGKRGGRNRVVLAPAPVAEGPAEWGNGPGLADEGVAARQTAVPGRLRA